MKTLTDQQALEMALARTLAEPDAGRVKQVRSMLQDRPRDEVMAFCSYHRQWTALRLKPWESPPCHAREDDQGPAGQLLRRMLAAGVSRYHPNPLKALKEAEG